MGVNKKYRRKIVCDKLTVNRRDKALSGGQSDCDKRQYVWYVSKEDDSFGKPVLHIISEDKKLIIDYPLECAKPYIVSKGKYFQGKENKGDFRRYLLVADTDKSAAEQRYGTLSGSRSGSDKMITPKFVAELIRWAEEGEEAVEVCYDGEDIWY